MPTWADLELTGWGRFQRTASRVARPERIRDLERVVAQKETASIIARGNGRSYGDAALNADGTILTTRLDRLLDFDPTTGWLTAEAGVTFGELVNTFVPRGYLPCVVPGTGFATLGGGLANDVHGKNHHVRGSLGQQLDWLDLRLPDGRLQRLSSADASPLLLATLGGVGLTGVIERARIRLEAVPSNAVRVRSVRMHGLDEYLERLIEEQRHHPYVVGWIDALASGRHLGRGILELAQPHDVSTTGRPKRAMQVPFDFPSVSLNRWSVRLFNELYYHRIPAKGAESVVPYSRFLFPLDSILDWNRIYGKRGFHQFQCVIPFEAARGALQDMLTRIARSGSGSFLAVLKTMGRPGDGYLSFSQPGYTLALDFPHSVDTVTLIHELEAITCAHGGRTYLAKDSTLSVGHFNQMYPRHHEFRKVLNEWDPAQRMASELSRRLQLTAQVHA